MMNERIKQLAEKAFQPINDITSEGVADRRTFNQLWFEHYNQNFAELIVQECIDIAQDRAAFDGFPPNDVNHIIDEIREHFGVEE